MSRVLRILGFGLWTGVMIGFAFIFAPTAFRVLGPTPQFATTIAHIIGSIAAFGYISAAAVILGTILDRAATTRSKVTAAVALVMAALSWAEMHFIVPIMQRTPIATPAYRALHHESSSIYGAVLVLGLAALVWSAWQERATAA